MSIRKESTWNLANINWLTIIIAVLNIIESFSIHV